MEPASKPLGLWTHTNRHDMTRIFVWGGLHAKYIYIYCIALYSRVVICIRFSSTFVTLIVKDLL